MKIKALIFIFLLVLVFAFVKHVDASLHFPKNWPTPVYDFKKNPPNQAVIALGRRLFYDPVLSIDSSISCASCHSPYNAFAHADHALSHGIHDSIGTRNAPALMNLAWHKNFMWDGAITNLDLQAIAPITHPKEMGETMPHVLIKLNRQHLYRHLSHQAYRDSSITSEKTLKALSQFVLSLISANSKYDSVMNHQAAFTKQEQNGYHLFRQHCSTCHTEPLFSNFHFENNGLPPDPMLKDYGRMLVTKNPKDSLLFKVPTLRNIAFTAPYMHDGRFKTLSRVLKHYTTGIHQNKTISKVLSKGVPLTNEESVDIIAFLLTLSDRSFLFNDAYHYPR